MKDSDGIHDLHSADAFIYSLEDMMMGRASYQKPQSSNTSDIDLDEIATYIDLEGMTPCRNIDGVAPHQAPIGIRSHMNGNISS